MSPSFRAPLQNVESHLNWGYRANLAARACAGLDLPADVAEGAVKKLVEAANSFLAIGFETGNEGDDLRAALAALGVPK
jgi:hypothetical protein